MMKKNIVLWIVMACCAVVAMAQVGNPQAEIATNRLLSASNHAAYLNAVVPDSGAQLTPAPAGYEPFYIAHYGRHGSRWQTSEAKYSKPIRALEVAERNHKLTAQGKLLLAQLREVAGASAGRVGELSDYGAEQHQGIARRMYHNFPSVFVGDAKVDARSTVIIRCILSMVNETSELKSLNPSLNITTDASLHDMPYMGWGHGEDTLANRVRKKMQIVVDSLKKPVDARRFVLQLVDDAQFVTDSLNATKLMEDVFTVAGGLQNHHQFDGMNMLGLFTAQELFDLWRNQNIYWNICWANSPYNGNRVPYQQRALLRNMLESADSAIVKGTRGASLRFGHETCLLPLACLMELDNANFSTRDIDNLHKHWQNYKIFPMGCNIQMVFYRKVGSTEAGDILVKILLNEHEAKLPFSTDKAPYYDWNTVKGYYYKKVNTAIDWN